MSRPLFAAISLVSLSAFLSLVPAAIPSPRDNIGQDCDIENDNDCLEVGSNIKINSDGEFEIEIQDWKNPPKKLPWSTIVKVKSPFETYRAVWDQDYRGSSCFLSCNFYNGFISRWTGETLSVAWFSTTCFSGNCSKRYQEIKSGVELIVNGQTFSVYGQGDDMVMPSNLRKALKDSPNPKISLRINGDNSAIYNIGDKTSRSIHALVKRHSEEDAELGSRGAHISLSSAISEAEKVAPILKRDLLGVAQISTPKGKGTGFLIDSAGTLLTNRHVVGRFESVGVEFNNGESYKANVIGRTSDLDVALLQLDRPLSRGIKPLPLCVKRDAPVGTDIVVIGNPLGLRSSITRGIVSAVRDENGSAILQIDAPVNSGNSGGPIVNYNAEVIGIVTSKMVALSVEGIGFGISLPSALESLGITIKNNATPKGSQLTPCGNFVE